MSVGFTVAKGDLDTALGQLATDTRDMLTRGQRIVDVLSNLTDTDLANMGYDSTVDVPLIRGVQSDISQLLKIFPGNSALPTAYDFLTNLSKLYGAKVS